MRVLYTWFLFFSALASLFCFIVFKLDALRIPPLLPRIPLLSLFFLIIFLLDPLLFYYYYFINLTY